MKLFLIRLKLIFDIFRLAGVTAPDPGVERFHLNDDAENGLRLEPVFAY